MRIISTASLKEGAVLAQTIYGNSGETLLMAGTEISTNILKRIRELDFGFIYIDDEHSNDIEVNDIIKPELRNKTVRHIKKIFNSIANVDEKAAVRFDKKTRELIKSIVDQVMTNRDMLIELIDLKSYDEYTFRHSVNVGVLSAAIGVAMSLPHKDVLDLTAAALFHDIGKMFVPAEILNKPGRLSDEEMETMQDHPRLGYEFALKYLPLSATSMNGILLHHEKCNGSGYPYNKNKKDISVFAKIIAICDVYDALTSDRCYKKASLPSEAVEYIMANCDEHFDSEVIDLFLKKVSPYPSGISVELSNGMKALVVKNNPEMPLRPVVRYFDETADLCVDLSDYKNASVVISAVIM